MIILEYVSKCVLAFTLVVVTFVFMLSVKHLYFFLKAEIKCVKAFSKVSNTKWCKNPSNWLYDYKYWKNHKTTEKKCELTKEQIENMYKDYYGDR